MDELGTDGVAAPPEGQPPEASTAAGRPRLGRRSRVRFEDAVSWFLSSWPYEGPKRPTPDTVRTYGAHLRWYVRYTQAQGKVRLDDALQPMVLRSALQAHMDEARGHSSAHKGGEAAATGMAQAARKLARWLLAQGVSVANLSAVKAPRPPERIQPRLLPVEFDAIERATLHQLIDGVRVSPQAMVARDLALIYMLYDTGLRCGEVANMTIDDVDFDRGRVEVRRGKGGKQRALSIVDAEDPRGGRTLRLLAEWLEARQHQRHACEHPRLWVSVPHGLPLSRTSLRRVLRNLCVAAGLDGNRPPHAFRRANFTEHYAADPRSVRLLAARMGWSDRSHHMVSIYTRGAEVEIAATQALPSLASQGRTGSPNWPSPAWPTRPILANGVSPGRGEATARPRQPFREDEVRTASVTPQRGSRL
jgi:integrase